jgi:hypothetical protein
MARLFDIKVTGEELLNDRMAWRVESEAKPGVKGADGSDIRNAHQVQAGNAVEVPATRRITWFDREDGAVARKYQILPGMRVTKVVRSRFYDYRKFTVDSTFTQN